MAKKESKSLKSPESKKSEPKTYYLITPESGINPQNIHQCFNGSIVYCDDIKGIKSMSVKNDDIWVIDITSDLRYEQIQSCTDGILWVNSLEGIKIL